MPPTKSPVSTTAPHPLATPVPPVKGAGVPMKVPLCIVVMLCVMVPLPIGEAVPLTLAAMEEAVELMCLYLPSWAHTLMFCALVTSLPQSANTVQKWETKGRKGRKGIQLPFGLAAVQVLVSHLSNTAA